MTRRISGVLAAALLLPAVLVTALLTEPGQAGATSGGGAYVAVTPTRILDTRGTTGTGTPVAAKATKVLQVTGVAGVPSGASAIVLNVTATAPSTAGFVTAYATGTAQPSTSNVNFTAGQTVANSVIAPVSSSGQITLLNGGDGTVQLVVDVFGYYTGGAPTAAGSFGAVTPTRLLDTRQGAGQPVSPNATTTVSVAGRAGVPSTSVAAVILNVTAVAPGAAGFLTVYPSGQAKPSTSSVNFNQGQNVPNLVVAPVGSDGSVTILNGSASYTHVIVDVFGYLLGPSPATSGAFGPLSPARILDTRSGLGAATGAVAAHSVVRLKVSGQGGVPTVSVAAVVLNLTATQPGTAGYLAAYPDSSGAPPTVSNVNFGAGQTVANAVIVPVASNGYIDLYNGSGSSTQIIADVSGFVLSAALPSPVTSTSRYIRNITTGGSGDVSTLQSEGCSDAQAIGSSANAVTVLDIGTQTTHTPLSASNPGVVLSATTTRLSYPSLVNALAGYVAGYVSCRTGSATATIALATTDDGDFSSYGAAQKGADWATAVVQPVRSSTSASGLSIIGAVDIEAGFAGTYAQASSWVTSFLGADSGKLLEIGSADGCPTSGVVGGSCAAIVDDGGATKTWTQAQYYSLAHGLSPTRILVMPQIYFTTQAQQWALIDETGASSSDRITFVGALTEAAACQSAGCDSLSAASGFAALWNALSGASTTSPPGLVAASDLQIDS